MGKGVLGVGITIEGGPQDLSRIRANLDAAQALGVETIEVPTYELDLVVGGRIRRDCLAELKSICAGRGVTYTVHGPLAINFLDEPYRLPRHFEVLQASIEVAAELGAIHYVVHSGQTRVTQSAGLEAAYDRQREWLNRGGHVAKAHGLHLCVENLFGGYHGKVHASTPLRLAAELAAIAHSHVVATLDFSHAHLNLGFAGGDLVAEVAALAPYAKHLHIHDSFGRQDDIWMYSDSERVAYGHGDLHLPVGWGDIPWDNILETCIFPSGVVFNIELNPRFWHLARECVEATRVLAGKARVGLAKAA
ncbi:MAG: sugar phosphate isomerase/epimerase [Methylobacteriaceae bacterium]|nr:sugar phosphate isomerase/epimerase [Methylobacteriaceae bacterium]MBV9636984.1 sugar phosphate isomerase/epimerase [Methylobacteriaceae bacterium]